MEYNIIWEYKKNGGKKITSANNSNYLSKNYLTILKDLVNLCEPTVIV